MKNILLIFVFIVAFSCEKKAPEIVNEEELITTAVYYLKATDGSEVFLNFKDLDGDGGNPPVIKTEPLKVNMTYEGTLILLDEASDPPRAVSNEVSLENKDHQVFYVKKNLPNLTISYSDKDENGEPLGLKTKLITGAASTGKLQITLKHNPNKSAVNVANGDITNAGGETDIQVEFDIVVK